MQAIAKDIQDAEKNTSNAKFISRPAETIVYAIEPANTVMDQLDATNLQPLRNFKAVVDAIANVRPSK